MTTITDQVTQILLDKYGVSLTLKELAIELKRSEPGLRVSLQQDGEASRQLNKAKTKVGRRIYFNTISIAKIITADLGTPH